MIFILLFKVMLNSFAFAGSYEVVGPCSPKPVFQGSFSLSEAQSAGKTSVEIFEREKIPYIGSELGFNSILNTPTDKEAIEWLGPNELRAYGWCYEVDGFQPAVMPSDFLLKGAEKLLWFFAFSHYKNGKFISQCEPSHTVKSKKFCQ